MSEKKAVMPHEHYEGICDKIRAATGKTELIPSGNAVKELDEAYRAVEESGYNQGYNTGFAQGQASGGDTEVILQSKTVPPSKSTQIVTADKGYTALEKVIVEPISDEYIVPSGTKEITENGTHDVTEYQSVDVDVPIPDGYIQPSGTLEVTSNGTHDVKNYESVIVNVAGSSTSEDLDAVLTEQEALISELKAALEGKAAGGGGDTTLPNGYVRTGYIQFTGEQIVDTGIICNQNTEMKFVFTRELSTSHYMFGVASSDNTAAVTAYMGGNWRFGNKAQSQSPATNKDMIYGGVISKSEITITGSEREISAVNEFEAIGTLLIGACRNSSGSVPSATYVGKIFCFVIWQGSTEVLHLSPVVSTDGVYRFYDEVSGNFFDSITETPLEGGNL